VRARKAAVYTLAGVAVATIGLLGARMASDYHLRGTEMRAHFESRFGVKWSGWKKDVEENPKFVHDISEAFEKEWIGKPFVIRNLRVVPKEFYKRDILEWADTLVNSEVAGRADKNHPGFGKYAVWIPPHVIASTVHHEVKHLRTYAALEKYPKMREEWEALSKRADGSSEYLGEDWNKVSYRFENELLQKGFVSSYARKNFLEDVAAFGEIIETEPDFIRSQLFSFSPPNRILFEKLSLAQKYGIVSPETYEYLHLTHRFIEEVMQPNFRNATATKNLLRRFIVRHPRSVYAPEVLKSMLEYERVGGVELTPVGMRIAQEILKWPHNEDAYRFGLRELTRVHEQRKTPRWHYWKYASKLFDNRLKEGDYLLPYRGVNDFLKEYELFH
jgi:hypothetical protein